MRLINAIVACEIFGLPPFDLRRQKTLKALLCQLVTVAGFTSMSASFQPGYALDKKIQSLRNLLDSRGFVIF